jgi:hypothetical protein
MSDLAFYFWPPRFGRGGDQSSSLRQVRRLDSAEAAIDSQAFAKSAAPL